jgi:hypothetical protein
MTAPAYPESRSVSYRSTATSSLLQMRRHPSLLMSYDKLGKRIRLPSRCLTYSVISFFPRFLRDLYIPCVSLFDDWSRNWRSLRALLKYTLLSSILYITFSSFHSAYLFTRIGSSDSIDTC